MASPALRSCQIHFIIRIGETERHIRRLDHGSDLLKLPDDGEEAVAVWSMREASGNRLVFLDYGLGEYDLVITHRLNHHPAANPMGPSR